jgi:hypothetical protein
VRQDDVGLSSSFKETMTITRDDEPAILGPGSGSFPEKIASSAALAPPSGGGSAKTRKPSGGAVTSAAAALGGQKDTDMGPPRATAPKPAPSAAAMLGSSSVRVCAQMCGGREGEGPEISKKAV